jgi:hypothetical protein
MRSTGQTAVERRAGDLSDAEIDERTDVINAIEEEIIAIPAATITGILGKLRVSADDYIRDDGGLDTRLMQSIFADAERRAAE